MREYVIIAAKLLAIFLAITGTFLVVNPPKHPVIVTTTIDGK